MMLTTSLMAIDLSSSDTLARTNQSFDAEDDRWNYVGDMDELTAALSDGGNIQLTDDISDAEQLIISKKTILNLGGYTITSATTAGQSAIRVESEAIIEKGEIIANGCDGIQVTGGSAKAMLILLDVYHNDSSGDSSAVSCINGGTLTIQNGSYTSDGCAVTLTDGGGTITVNDGTFSGKSSTLRIDANVDGSYELKILTGIFDDQIGANMEYEVFGSAGSVDAKIFSGEFKGKIDARYGTTKIYGGSFTAECTTNPGCMTIFGGKFINKPEGLIDTDSEWDETTHSVNQTKSIYIGETPYNTLNEALMAVDIGQTVTINKTGTYKLGYNNGRNMTIVGNENEDIVLMYEPGLYSNSLRSNDVNYKVDISNVTLYMKNEAYQGFLHSSMEHYSNVTFWGCMYLYASEESIFDNCIFEQYYDCYSINNYGTESAEFNGCTFNSVGKSLLLYVDISKEYPGGIVHVDNTKFIDHGLLKKKAAIEVHSEWADQPDYSYWSVYIDNGTTATGFYEHSECGNNLWNAVNNNLGSLSNTTEIYIGQIMHFPCTVKILDDDGSELRIINQVIYGQMITRERIVVPEPKTGYVFSGYYDPVSMTRYFDENGDCVHTMDVSPELVLHPLWSSMHTISFDINGATGVVPDSMEVTEGCKFMPPSDSGFSLDGYNFVGWSDGYKTYKAGDEYMMGDSDIVLKAIWSTATPYDYGKIALKITIKDMYDVIITDDTATVYVGPNTEITNDGTVTFADIDKKFYTVVVELTDKGASTTQLVDLTECTGPEKDLSVKFDDYHVKTKVEKTPESDIDVAVSDNIRGLAKEKMDEAHALDVKLELIVDNSATMAKSIKNQLDIVKSQSSLSECTFFDAILRLTIDGKTSLLSETGTDTIELVIPFDSNGKTIELWHCHDGMEVQKFENNQTGDAGTFYYGEGVLHIFTNKFSAFVVMSSEAGTYTVLFDVDGGSVDISRMGNIVKGRTIVIPEYKGVKEGYTFEGWECNGTVYKGSEPISVSGDMTFKAQWKETTPEPPGPPVPPSDGNDNSWVLWLLIIIALVVCALVIYRVSRKNTGNES